MPSITHVPASSPAISGVTVITEHVFTRKFDLVVGHRNSGLSSGAKAGLALGTCVGVIAIAAGVAMVWLRHRKAAKNRAEQTTFYTDKDQKRSTSPATRRYELPSPGPHSPPDISRPLSSQLPPAYATNGHISPPPPKSHPQELPGSYFIHENHPAIVGSPGPTHGADRPKSESEQHCSPIVSPLDIKGKP